MIYSKIILFLRRRETFLGYGLIIVCAALFFSWIQGVPTFADPDSFYHIRSALLIPQEGIIKQFPWLQVSVLKNSYIDQHFLYHIYLVPFVMALPPFVGAKVATVVLNTAVIVLFYWFLRRYRIKYAPVYIIILLATMPFIFRIDLVKASGFSILFLLFGLHFIFQHKKVALFILSFFYVWAYGGFVLILIVSGIYAIVSLLQNWMRSPQRRSLTMIMGYNQELRLFFSALGGVISGLVVNPYFPQNLTFYWSQLIKIGIINYQAVIPVGNEWYPYKFIDLTANTAFVSILIVLTLYLFTVHFRPFQRRTITMGLIFLFFFLFTLKSRRYVEYYVPFTLLFTAFGLNQHLDQWSPGVVWWRLWRFWSRHRVILTTLVVYIIVIIPAIIVKDIRHTHDDFVNGIPLNRFAQSSRWLAEHSQPGDIVFHSSWDEFPMLFYYNQKNYYIAGLDPTFSYEYDPELYKTMVNITLGDQKEGLYDDIKYRFKARYVFVEKKHTSMNRQVREEDGFKQVYEDEETIIYEII